MNPESATVEMIDALASIEMQRQKREKESGVPVSCSWALGKLYEVLPRKNKSKSPGTEAERVALQADIEAATLAIGRVRKLAQITGQRAKPRGDRPWHQQKSWRDAQKTFSGDRPRRTTNRQHP